ncbi:MAG: hypothetical protein ABI467_17685 [Kofleriaceae bacterium]
MTTERRQPNRRSRLGVSSLELRLYMAGLLAAVYTISWRATGGQAQAPATALPERPIATAPTTTEPQRFVWIDNLPPDMRPAIALPAGWQIAAEPQPSAITQPTRVVRVPSRRVRTRSS